MAAVYLAVQESLDRQVALKVLDQTFADDRAFSERFLNEGRIIASLNHSNIITIYDVSIVGGLHYISMEYVNGGDLKARIAKGVDPATALKLVHTIGGCLDFAHRVGVVHRDVKPANILFRKDGTPLLTDFGIAKQLTTHSELTMTGSVLGSPGYLAPEQAEGRDVDGRADIYSLGIIFYEMLLGKKPYEGDSDLSTIFKHLSEPIPELPSDLARCQPLLNQMIAKKPDERFKDAASMLAFIRSMRASGPLTSRPIVKPAAPKKSAKKNRGRGSAGKWIGMGLGVPIVLAGAAVVANSLLPAPIPGMEGVREMTARIWPGVSPQGALPTPPRRQPANPAAPRKPAPAQVTTNTLNPQPTVASTRRAHRPGVVTGNNHAGAAGKRKSVSTKPQRDAIWYRIDKLLTLGDKALQGYRLTKPDKDNALYYYRQVLQLAPKNSRARAGLKTIAIRYATLADRELGSGNLEKAKGFVGLGLKADSRNPRLLRLKRNVETQIRIVQLLAQADNALADKRLRTPPNDNAFYYFEKVLELEPDNRQAEKGFRAIANQYARLAEAHISNYEYDHAQRYITLGLEVQPNDDRLLALRDEAHIKNAPKHLMNNFKGFFRGLKSN